MNTNNIEELPRPINPVGIVLTPDYMYEEEDQNNYLEEFNQRATRVGPVELTILERLEAGLAQDYNRDNEQQGTGVIENQKEETMMRDISFTGDKEIIHVEGWIKQSAVYRRYLSEFIFKLVLGLAGKYLVEAGIKSKKETEPIEVTHIKRYWILSILIVFFCFLHLLKSLYFWKMKTRKLVSLDDEIDLTSTLADNTKENFTAISNILKYEALFNTAYIFYFGSLALFFYGVKTTFQGFIDRNEFNRLGGWAGLLLLLSPVPFAILSLHMCKIKHKKHSYTSSKALSLFECVQMILLVFKLTGVSEATWQYTTFMVTMASVYCVVIGVIHVVLWVLSFFRRDVVMPMFKRTGIFFLGVYYVGYGHSYMSLIKGFILDYEYSKYSLIIQAGKTEDMQPQSGDQTLKMGFMELLVTSVILLIILIFKKKSIDRFLKEVVYKEELRKEVSLKRVKGSFKARFVMMSSSFFKFDYTGEEVLTEIEGELAQNETDGICLICLDKESCVVLDPCGHGGICKTCVVRVYMETGEDKESGECPLCRKKFLSAYVIGKDETGKKFKILQALDFTNISEKQ